MNERVKSSSGGGGARGDPACEGEDGVAARPYRRSHAQTTGNQRTLAVDHGLGGLVRHGDPHETMVSDRGFVVDAAQACGRCLGIVERSTSHLRCGLEGVGAALERCRPNQSKGGDSVPLRNC